MELPADTPPGSSTELERLAKVQLLGEQADLGRPRVETPGASKTAAESGPAKIPGKTATPGGGQAAAIATAIREKRKASSQREAQPQPQHREVQPQHSQPQQREAAPKQMKPAQGKPEKAQGKSDQGARETG